MDVLNDMLAALRLSGGVFVDAELRAPFNVLSEVDANECARYFTLPRHVIAYHYVRDGAMRCRVGDGAPVEVHAGQVVLLPRNDSHLVHSCEPPPPLDHKADIVADGRMFRISAGGDGAPTRIYCGYLGTDTTDNLLLDSLPAMLVIDAEAAGGWMARSIAFAAEELGGQSPETVGKMAEALFAEAVRRYVAGLPDDAGGWLAGLRDPAVGRALAMIHARYAEAWTLDELAREAGVSKTVLVERFRALTGEAPMHYCARWRMKVAAEMLRDERHNASSVAYSVGFNSEAAFSRAFKREYGTPPATWRRELVAA